MLDVLVSSGFVSYMLDVLVPGFVLGFVGFV